MRTQATAREQLVVAADATAHSRAARSGAPADSRASFAALGSLRVQRVQSRSRSEWPQCRAQQLSRTEFLIRRNAVAKCAINPIVMMVRETVPDADTVLYATD